MVRFSRLHPDSRGSLEAWYQEVKSAIWTSSADIKSHYPSASIINNSRVVINICGNKYRLVVQVNYPAGIVYVRFIGTHKEYDRIDVESV